MYSLGYFPRRKLFCLPFHFYYPPPTAHPIQAAPPSQSKNRITNNRNIITKGAFFKVYAQHPFFLLPASCDRLIV